MAPSTALLFLLLGACVFARAGWPGNAALARWVLGVAAAASLVSAGLTYTSLRGIYLEAEHLGLPIRGLVAGVPAGHISPLTAGLSVIVGASLLVAPGPRSGSLRRASVAFCLACVVFLASVVLVIGYLMGSPLLQDGHAIPPALPTSIGFFVLGVGALILHGVEVSARAPSAYGAVAAFPTAILVTYLFLVVAIVAAGTYDYRRQARIIKTRAEQEMGAVASLKAGQLERWRAGRLADADLFHDNTEFSRLVGRHLAGQEEARAALRAWLRGLLESPDYDRIRLYDASGVVRLERPEPSQTGGVLAADGLAQASASREPFFRDFYRDAADLRVYLDLLVPIFGPEPAGLTAVLELRIDPRAYLYPMIMTWPTASPTAETLLIRSEGGDALFLNELRFAPNSALNLRIPLQQTQAPAVQAVLGHVGAFDGIDYRGVPVVSALRPVAGSPWFLVARVDTAEAIAPVTEKRRDLAALVAVLLAGTGAAMGAMWRHRRARYYHQRLRATEIMRAGEERFAAAFRAGSVFMATADTWGALSEVNEYACAYLGYTREELRGKTPSQLGALADQRSQAEYRRAVGAKEPTTVELTLRTRDGSRRHGILTVETIQGPGDPYRLLILTDITGLKNAEHRVRKLNRVYALLSGVNQAIVRVRDPDILFERVCRYAVDQGGFPLAWVTATQDGRNLRVVAAAGVAGKPLESVRAAPEGGHGESCTVATALRKGTPAACDVLDAEGCQLCRRIALEHGARSMASFPLVASGNVRGTITFCSAETGFLDEEETRLLEELAMDISFAMEVAEVEEARRLTEARRKRLEEQFLQAQKMEAVGRLAGGIAHDFNNMLQIITSYADMTLAALDVSDPLRDYVLQMANAGKRSTELTQQLLTFARKQVISPKDLDLSETVAGNLKMLGRLIGEDIDLLWRPAADTVPVRADPSQISQILANLVVNSRDAILANGKITIETASVVFDREYCDQHAGFQPGRYAMLAVSDDGVGMDKATMARLYEPFFTTKPQGRGTGLGLATVYGIVKQNEGFIDVYSEPAKGATFRIYLPEGPTTTGHAGPTAPRAEPAGGHETLLLVEDEAGLLRLFRTMLESLGYVVLAAGTPKGAMEMARTHAGRIHLLLSDVVMPDMSGRDLWLRLRQLRPELKCIFMSGYTAEAIVHRGVLEDGIDFLQKPFSLEDLAAKIRAALSVPPTVPGELPP